jgi:hypothetical protein
MRRVAPIGSGGAGESTPAVELGRRTGLPSPTRIVRLASARAATEWFVTIAPVEAGAA